MEDAIERIDGFNSDGGRAAGAGCVITDECGKRASCMAELGCDVWGRWFNNEVPYTG